VADGLYRSGGSKLTQTVFYARSGHSVSVPSNWFQKGGIALGLSRAQLDAALLERAKDCGATVLEDSLANDLGLVRGHVCFVSVKYKGSQIKFFGDIIIDATGRSRSLLRHLGRRNNGYRTTKPALVAFKAHLRNTQAADYSCEIYVYPGGYGGLNRIEGNLSNLCFIVSAKVARKCESDPLRMMNTVLAENRRAAYTLKEAEVASPWLAVSLNSFGEQNPVHVSGLLAVGDASAFIDPFTGSGILMALESAELAAAAILAHSGRLRQRETFNRVAKAYRDSCAHAFKSRFRVSALLRRAAFLPRLADTAILISRNKQVRQLLTRATRAGNREKAYCTKDVSA
jgi:flavin-dependent dehydrogenase